MPVKRLTYESLYNRCDPESFNFKTTEDLATIKDFIGQERAKRSLETGTGIKHRGYNIFVMGRAGTGRHVLTKEYLESITRKDGKPYDWCYVNNFKNSHKPYAIKLDPGRAYNFKKHMDDLVNACKRTLNEAFESNEYMNQRRAITEQFNKKNEELYRQLESQARSKNIAMVQTPQGIVFVPMNKNGKNMSQEEFQQLDDATKEDFSKKIVYLQEELQALMRKTGQMRKEMDEQINALNKDTARNVIDPLLKQLKSYYSNNSKIQKYLDEVEEDIVENFQDFIYKDYNQQEDKQNPFSAYFKPSFKRYSVNVLVCHENSAELPIIYEQNPTYQNLVGRIEHTSQMGTLMTDFTLIKPGSLHSANGGYLILDVRKLLMQPYAWEGLKRVIRSESIKTESIQELLSLTSTVTLEPEEIPLKLKVVLIGERIFYYLLSQYDPDFLELFKVVADFEEEIIRTDENMELYSKLIASIVSNCELKPLNRYAVAKVIDASSRKSGDTKKLSIHMQSISDLLKEADHFADIEGRNVIEAQDIKKALEEQEFRGGRIKERLYESIKREIKLISTEGEKTGQLNALTVMQLGQLAFGSPAKITATVRIGEGKVIDIEREVKFGGPIHSKGVLILSGFLGDNFGKKIKLGLTASIVFEQSYGGVDGDSASLAELCAILSAISEKPIKQNIALTGSVNQKGEVQAIGGVNEKIEGFFKVCKEKGLTGKQGVIIPKSNIDHLLLNDEVLKAVKEGNFSIYAVENVSEALKLLTGYPLGERNTKGNFKRGSLGYYIEKKIREYNEAGKTKRTKQEPGKK
ncbi:Lon protease family protein [Flexistipes sp.]|uniref:Lon protease family protein n=1 Tax=Flexistipes sp. TaxID=3088135 RepID=UPI002E1AE223|nr:ATP-binding protein [Flexistipes sp.]